MKFLRALIKNLEYSCIIPRVAISHLIMPLFIATDKAQAVMVRFGQSPAALARQLLEGSSSAAAAAAASSSSSALAVVQPTLSTAALRAALIAAGALPANSSRTAAASSSASAAAGGASSGGGAFIEEIDSDEDEDQDEMAAQAAAASVSASALSSLLPSDSAADSAAATTACSIPQLLLCVATAASSLLANSHSKRPSSSPSTSSPSTSSSSSSSASPSSPLSVHLGASAPAVVADAIVLDRALALLARLCRQPEARAQTLRSVRVLCVCRTVCCCFVLLCECGSTRCAESICILYECLHVGVKLCIFAIFVYWLVDDSYSSHFFSFVRISFVFHTLISGRHFSARRHRVRRCSGRRRSVAVHACRRQQRWHFHYNCCFFFVGGRGQRRQRQR